MRAHTNKLFETGKTIIPKTMKLLGNKNDKNNLGLLKIYLKYKLFYSWNDIVGKDIAKYIIPQDVTFSVLYVYTYSSVWANSFQYLKLDTIKKINEYLGYKLIKDIQFTRFNKVKRKIYSPILEKKVNLGSYIKQVEITDEDLNLIDKKTDCIEDEDLKSAIKKVYMKNLQLKKLKEKYNWIPCKKCGHLTLPENPYCYNCQREIKEEKQQKIAEILLEIPWARYQDIIKYVDCSMDMVNKQRTKLVQILASKLKPGVDYPVDDVDNFKYSIDAQTVVMMYKSIPPDKLNKNVLKDTIFKLRYDTAYWEYKKRTE